MQSRSSVATRGVIGEMLIKGIGKLTKLLFEDGSRLFGVYHLKDKTKIWIITEVH